ncbi:capsular polysaccharide transport system permease protein [Sphingomonas sp. PvP055]|uniref:lipopolysaccharide biosynthesis protein n=1 Tax=Sphingomonas sp. PvP055 TaxID=3156391 RepID=UPI003398E6DA
MNNQSHNWFEAQALPEFDQRSTLRRWWDGASAWRYPLLLVVLPTLIVAAYFYLVAADQYESEAHFIVSTDTSGGGGGASSFGAMFGLGGAGSQNQTMAVPDYLSSHEAIADLSRKLDLVAMFRRPEADVLSRLRKSNPTPEDLQRYFEGKVKVQHQEDGIIALTVHAFRPADAHAIADALMALGEEQVNRMNRRRYRDAVAQAQAHLAEAKQRVSQIQGRMTAYRQQGRDINPEASGETQLRLVSSLKGQLASAQASFAAMKGTISTSSPQYIALQRSIRSLQSVIASQSSELTGNSRTIASNLGGYENLRVQQEFGAKNYTAAAAGLVKAQEDAARQQLYIVRVVDANMPVKSLYPKRGRTVLITFFALALAYAIGWLILAGVREHAA